MNFKKEKFIKILMFLISKSSIKYNVGKTVLWNMLYFVDFDYFETYGEMLTGEKYLKSEYGALPVHFGEIIRELVYYDKVFLRKEPYFDTLINKYYLTSIHNINLDNKELLIINDVLDRLSDFAAVEIVEYVSADMPFKIANFEEELDYSYVFYRDFEYSAFYNHDF